MADEIALIKDFMTKGAITISPNQTVKQASELMTQKNISCLIVVNTSDTSEPIGILSERDFVQKVVAKGMDPAVSKVSSIMTVNPHSIPGEATLEEGLHLIESHNIRRLPVVEHGKLIGLITQTDIVKQTAKIHSSNRKLRYHQNLQSYVIIGLLAIFLIAFFIKTFIL